MYVFTFYTEYCLRKYCDLVWKYKEIFFMLSLVYWSKRWCVWLTRYRYYITLLWCSKIHHKTYARMIKDLCILQIVWNLLSVKFLLIEYWSSNKVDTLSLESVHTTKIFKKILYWVYSIFILGYWLWSSGETLLDKFYYLKWKSTLFHSFSNFVYNF